eukprot:gene399-6813_t
MSFRDPAVEQNEKFSLYDDELTQIEQDIQKLIVEIKQTDDEEDRVDKIKKAKKLLEQSKKTYQNLSNVVKKETREHSKEMMAKSKDEHKNELNRCKTYLSQAVTDLKDEEEKKKRLEPGTNEQTMDSNQQQGPRKSEPIRMENDNFIEKQQLSPEQQIQIEKELFKDVFQAHQDSLDIIERLNIKIMETTDIAIDSAQLLREQREELMEIEQEVDQLGGEIKRGAREIGSILRRLAADKFLLLGAIALIVGILIAINQKNH